MTDRPKNDPRTPPETGPVRSLPASTPAPASASAASPSPSLSASASPGASVSRPAAAPRPVPERGPRLWPRVAGALILLAGVGGAWVWQNPEPARRLFTQGGNAEREAAETRVKTLETRLARLEQRPAADPARLDALEKRPSLDARLEALEKRPLPAPVDTGPLLSRLDALEARSTLPFIATSGVDLRPYIARIEALEQQTARPGIDPARIEALERQAAKPGIEPARIEALEKLAARPAVEPARLDALATRIEAVAARDPAADLRTRLAETEKQVTGLTGTASTVTGIADRTARIARAQAVSAALAAGQKLGSIPDAPPALARFATVAPPTEAALRLAFPAAEAAALNVSLPDMKGKPLLDRMLARLQDYHLITVRQGDEVVVGNLTAETLNHAHTLLRAGDLAGAVKTVSTLTGDPAKAMAAWLEDAKALLAAREALAVLTGNG